MIRRKRVIESEHSSDMDRLYKKFVDAIEKCRSDFRKLNNSIYGVSKVLEEMAIKKGTRPEKIYTDDTKAKRWSDLYDKFITLENDMLNDFEGDMAFLFDDI